MDNFLIDNVFNSMAYTIQQSVMSLENYQLTHYQLSINYL